MGVFPELDNFSPDCCPLVVLRKVDDISEFGLPCSRSEIPSTDLHGFGEFFHGTCPVEYYRKPAVVFVYDYIPEKVTFPLFKIRKFRVLPLCKLYDPGLVPQEPDLGNGFMGIFPELDDLYLHVRPLPFFQDVFDLGQLGLSLPGIKFIFRNGIFLQDVIDNAALRLIVRDFEFVNQFVKSFFDVLDRHIDAKFQKPVLN